MVNTHHLAGVGIVIPWYATQKIRAVIAQDEFPVSWIKEPRSPVDSADLTNEDIAHWHGFMRKYPNLDMLTTGGYGIKPTADTNYVLIADSTFRHIEHRPQNYILRSGGVHATPGEMHQLRSFCEDWDIVENEIELLVWKDTQ